MMTLHPNQRVYVVVGTEIKMRRLATEIAEYGCTRHVCDTRGEAERFLELFHDMIHKDERIKRTISNLEKLDDTDFAVAVQVIQAVKDGRGVTIHYPRSVVCHTPSGNSAKEKNDADSN